MKTWRPSPEYVVWMGIKQRCTNPKHERYSYYSKVGICDEWRKSFKAFIAYMGPRPSKAHSVDRIDNNRGYEPGNVRWALPGTQARNRRENLIIEGFCLADWSYWTGISVATLHSRIRKLGWDPVRAVTTPTKGRYESTAKLTPDKVQEIRTRYSRGELCSAMASEFGVTEETVRAAARLRTHKHV